MMKKRWEKWAGNESIPAKDAEIPAESREAAGLFPSAGRGANGLPLVDEEAVLAAKEFVDEESRL